MLGMILFLLGLLTGLVMINFKNPRMGLSAHMEGILNGIFLVITGIIWKELRISKSLGFITFSTLIYGTYMNLLTTLFAAYLGTSNITPVTGAGFHGTDVQEQFVTGGFISVGVTMLFSLLVIIYGLRKVNITMV
jgi:(hydroxyamino)benzene mutase